MRKKQSICDADGDDDVEMKKSKRMMLSTYSRRPGCV